MDSIHSKDIYPIFKFIFTSLYVLCLLLLACVTFSLVLIFLRFTFLGCFWDFFVFFLQTGWEPLQVKHFEVKVLKMLQ
jgi:hypothetical protein